MGEAIPGGEATLWTPCKSFHLASMLAQSIPSHHWIHGLHFQEPAQESPYTAYKYAWSGLSIIGEMTKQLSGDH